MKTTDVEALAELANLLATDSWVIHEYKIINEDAVTLTIVQNQPEKREGENG